MNPDLRKNQKMVLKKTFVRWWIMEKLFCVRTNLSYYKVFYWKSVRNRNEKPQILMNKPVYLGSSILDLRKIIMFEFSYDYGKPKYGEKQNHVIRVVWNGAI